MQVVTLQVKRKGKTMTYTKPEINALGDAARVIRNLVVKDPTEQIPDQQFPFTPLQPAYDLDE